MNGGGSRAPGLVLVVTARYRQQARETNRSKREALLHQIQQLLHERVRFGPIWEITGRVAWGRAWRSRR